MNTQISFPDYRVRNMFELDLATIVSIERALYDFPWDLLVFKDCVSTAGYRCLVLEYKRAIIAYGILSIGPRDADILNLGVAFEYHNQGIGTYLLQHILVHICSNLWLDRILLDVRVSNASAIKMYLKAGFCKIGLSKGYYQTLDGDAEDAFRMAYFLNLSQGRENIH